VAKALKSGRLNRHFDYEVIGDPRTKRRVSAVDWVVEGAKRCLAGDLAALATAPITKSLCTARLSVHRPDRIAGSFFRIPGDSP